MLDPIAQLRSELAAAVGDAGGDPQAARSATLEPAARPEFGDFSSNLAMVTAGSASAKPRDFAELLGEALTKRLDGRIERFEVAGPGFLNLFLSDRWYRESLAEIATAGDRFGSGGAEQPTRFLVEFVSANPTGPLTAAGGRHAAYGDALARLLEFHGHEVRREFYVNDAGTQVQRLGLSIQARARGEEIPEDGYSGDYVVGLAGSIPNASERDPAELATVGVGILRDQIEATLSRYRVEFDHWFSELTLHQGENSPLDKAIGQLRESGHTFEEEGALWLRTTEFGDDKDRVLIRSDGEPTYFAGDVAYHADKLSRSDHLIDVLGADHHGYVGRMKAAMATLGGDPSRLEMLIMQFVHLVEGGDRSQMSKRRGDFVTLDDLLEMVGVDAARWFMLQRSHDTTVDLDLDLARQRTAENPVFYVQYAHARCFSVITKAEGDLAPVSASGPELHSSERTLIRRLAVFPQEVEEAAERRAPHRICSAALLLAQEFTAFYRDCRVVGAPPEEQAFRLALIDTAKTQIAAALGLLGVEAPDEL